MTAEAPDDTRTRILRAALDLFAEHGYQRTPLRQIAERLRLTKAAILYHFPTKEHLLTALIEPMVADFEALLDAAEEGPAERARWTVLEGWVDIILGHRRPLGMLFHDIALVGRGDTYHRLIRIAMRANDLIAGPDAGRRERVRAVQAVAACSDPVVFFVDVPDAVLRADMLDGVRRLLGDPTGSGPADGSDQADGAGTAGGESATGGGGGAGTPAAGGAAGRRRRPGRPRAMSPEQVEAARRMHAGGDHSADEIAAALGVSRATVYRHLDPAVAK
ncbi:TetR family transcriptional regulator [Micromonospora sp. DSM 115977]|uniref:TetR family transcriptional regulator n=1 Tax=Micromonospora reichwaldensis TaxID=3075516 RepID=A0ABU2WYP4_9ACTN|nr:TetR family transcriptional regulator [Micromonospora sp. DSM 115977]MDT0530645.1 TetR family transcriptional regulator [Micromonospora sp. DSM 115977]